MEIPSARIPTRIPTIAIARSRAAVLAAGLSISFPLNWNDAGIGPPPVVLSCEGFGAAPEAAPLWAGDVDLLVDHLGTDALGLGVAPDSDGDFTQIVLDPDQVTFLAVDVTSDFVSIAP